METKRAGVPDVAELMLQAIEIGSEDSEFQATVLELVNVQTMHEVTQLRLAMSREEFLTQLRDSIRVRLTQVTTSDDEPAEVKEFARLALNGCTREEFDQCEASLAKASITRVRELLHLEERES